MFRHFLTILIILSLTICWGQRTSHDFEKELKTQNSAIQSLRNEIEATKNRIQKEGRKEKTSARRVNNLSEEISLLQRLVREIAQESKSDFKVQLFSLYKKQRKHTWFHYLKIQI